MVSKGNHPQMAARFRLVKYDNLPRWHVLLWRVYFWLAVWNMNFMFPYIGNNHPNWLIFFRGVETTSQIYPCNILPPYWDLHVFFWAYGSVGTKPLIVASWICSFPPGCMFPCVRVSWRCPQTAPSLGLVSSQNMLFLLTLGLPANCRFQPSKWMTCEWYFRQF